MPSPPPSARTGRPSPTWCGCSSCPTRCRRRSPRDACRWATRARCSRCPTQAAQRTLARDIIARSLSVRETEGLVKKSVEPGPAPRRRAGAAAAGRPHARGRGQAASAARHARAHRAARQEGAHRDRVRQRRGVDPDLRRVVRQLTASRGRHRGVTMTPEAPDRARRLRGLSEQTRRWRARSRVERPSTADRSAGADRLQDL